MRQERTIVGLMRPVRWSQSSDLGGPLVFPAPAVVLLTNNCYRRLRRPFAARSLRRRCCRAGMRSSRALDAAPRHRARACVLPRCAERRGPPRRRQPTVAVLVGLDDGEPNRCILAGVGVWPPRDVAGTVRRGELAQFSTLIAAIGIGQAVRNGGQVMAVGLPEPGNNAPLVIGNGNYRELRGEGSRSPRVMR